MVLPAETGQTGWWESSSNTVRALVVGAPLVLVAALGALLFSGGDGSGSPDAAATTGDTTTSAPDRDSVIVSDDTVPVAPSSTSSIPAIADPGASPTTSAGDPDPVPPETPGGEGDETPATAEPVPDPGDPAAPSTTIPQPDGVDVFAAYSGSEDTTIPLDGVPGGLVLVEFDIGGEALLSVDNAQGEPLPGAFILGHTPNRVAGTGMILDGAQASTLSVVANGQEWSAVFRRAGSGDALVRDTKFFGDGYRALVATVEPQVLDVELEDCIGGATMELQYWSLGEGFLNADFIAAEDTPISLELPGGTGLILVVADCPWELSV